MNIRNGIDKLKSNVKTSAALWNNNGGLKGANPWGLNQFKSKVGARAANKVATNYVKDQNRSK